MPMVAYRVRRGCLGGSAARICICFSWLSTWRSPCGVSTVLCSCDMEFGWGGRWSMSVSVWLVAAHTTFLARSRFGIAAPRALTRRGHTQARRVLRGVSANRMGVVGLYWSAIV